MLAIRIHEAGGPEVIRLEDVPTPKPGPKEVLVRLCAASLNRRDVNLRQGRQGTGFFPFTPGSDGAGVVEETGADVAGISPGGEVLINPYLSDDTCGFCLEGQHSLCSRLDVIGAQTPGTYAQYIKLPQSALLPKPPELSWEHAAALPTAGVTAYHLLFTRAGLRAGEKALILGIGGGVASFALQMAKFAGATAIVTSSSEEKLAHAKAMGADFCVNYKKADWATAVLDITGGRGVDVVVETIGAATWADSIRAVRRGGRIAICGGTSGWSAETNLRDLYWKQVSIIGCTGGNRADFSTMAGLYSTGGLRPVIDASFPLAEASRAHKRLEEQEQFGKIVLKIQ